MISFGRKTDYALIGLAHLAGNDGRTSSARELAETYGLAVSLMMKVLKTLHQRGMVRSVRGVKGGYQLAIDLRSVSLYELIMALAEPDTREPVESAGAELAATSTLPTEPPLQAVHYKLMRFLQDVKLWDLVLPGRRIDVPVELVRRKTASVDQAIGAAN